MNTERRSFVFQFDAALQADDPVARWVTCVSMAWNDIVFVHDLYVEHDDGGRGVYLVRVAAGHLSEILDPKGPFGAGYDDWTDVQAFVAALPKKARGDLERLRSIQADRSTSETLGWRLDRMRNHVFHYPHLHNARSGGTRLEVSRALRKKEAEDGSITLDGGTVKGTRLGFADEISISLALERAEIDVSDVAALRAFTRELLDVQLRFIRFGEVAIDRYLRALREGVLRDG